ncbi:tbc1 domain family member [Anaeramoeba ignava]|uniref:Tbc1 domain family member n=1 Tax=Anaeramoeba ignava TaxID=1746090 RepID=A0A9Q0LE82_ANAIG|nr:tbc1 domain family member [Anaeramoeba ignava]
MTQLKLSFPEQLQKIKFPIEVWDQNLQEIICFDCIQEYLNDLLKIPEIESSKPFVHFIHPLPGHINRESYLQTKTAEMIQKENRLLKKWEKTRLVGTRYEISKKFKKQLRKGVPDKFRKQVWLLATGGKELLAKQGNFYMDQLEKLFGDHVPEHISEFPIVADDEFHKFHHFIDTVPLERILAVLSDQHHDISYCVSISDIISILLVFLEESECYAAIHCMVIMSKKGRKYFETTKTNTNLFEETFRKLLWSKVPSVARKMNELGIQPGEFYSDWFQRTFVTDLPFQAVLRVFDCFLYEGTKIFYRVALSVFMIMKKNLLNAKSKEEFRELVRNFLWNIDNIDAILKKGFSILLSRSGFDKIDQENLKMKRDVLESKIIKKASHVEPIRGSLFRIKIHESGLIKNTHAQKIYLHIPRHLHSRIPKLIFSTETHGFTLGKLYATCALHSPPFILVIKPFIEIPSDYLCGAFLTYTPQISEEYYGDGLMMNFYLMKKLILYLLNQNQLLKNLN